MKKPDLLILIAIWEFITAFFAFLGIAAIAIFTFPVALGAWGDWGYYSYRMMSGMPHVGAIFGLSVAILVLLCYMALAIGSGIGLLHGKEWGRIAGIVHSTPSLFCVPVGTVIGVLSIIYLTTADVKDYFNPTPKA